MWDNIAILKGNAEITQDEYLNEIITYTENEVFVQPRSVYSSEFYQAAQVGLHPSLTLELANRDDYNGETLLTFEDNDYTVIRADWDAQRDKLRLICEKRVVNE